MRGTILDVFHFHVCGARDHVFKLGGFGFISAAIAFISDVFKPFHNSVWIFVSVFAAGLVASVLVMLRGGRRFAPLTTVSESGDPPRVRRIIRERLPGWLGWGRGITLFCAAALGVLLPVGIVQAMLAAPGASSDSVSIGATLMPALRGLRRDVADVRDEVVKVRQVVETQKKETSTDPRKELANLGTSWNTDAFFEAIRRGDVAIVKLFVQGGMSTAVNDSQGRSLPIIVALNETNPGAVLDELLDGGLDINAAYQSSGVMSAKHIYTLLGRAIDKDHLVLVSALLARKAGPNVPYDTFAVYGFSRRVRPLQGAIAIGHPSALAPLLDAGADISMDNYAAYRDARSKLDTKRGTVAELQTLREILPRLKPTGSLLQRIDDELALEQVDRLLSEVALAGLRAISDPVEKKRLDAEYDRLQVERRRLRSVLGINDEPAPGR